MQTTPLQRACISQAGPLHPSLHVQTLGPVQLPFTQAGLQTATSQSVPLHPDSHVQVFGAEHVP